MLFTKDLPFIAKTVLQKLCFCGLAIVLGLLYVNRAEAQLRSDLQLFSDSFVSPSFETSQKTNYQFAGIHLRSAPLSEDALKMDIRGAVAFGSPLLNYLDIKELYFQSLQSENDKLFIGRKLSPWSDLDQRWNLGLWQPVFQWNPLSAEQQGLSGIFWEAQRPSYSLTVFGSPLYLPNQGPSFEVTNGAFVDGSPWFRRPPEKVKIFGEETAVDYTLEKPSESQVVFKPSYGARLSLGNPDGLLGQVSYMYKPSNELALGYTALSRTSDLKAEVTLKPQVFYHSILGADVAHRLQNFRYGVSAILDRPQKNIDLDERWTKPEFADAVLVSPFVEWNQTTWLVTLQALNIEGGEVTETGPRARSEKAPLTLRYPFQQAAMASLENRLALYKAKRLASKIMYTLSDKNKFEFLQWELKLKWSPTWTFFSEVELVQAEDATFENQNEIAQYRNLDRFLIGAAYVF